MKKVGVMTDSHSGITPEEAKRVGIHLLAMPFTINGEIYLEGVDFTHEEFYEKLNLGVDVSTSQPSPQDTMDMWDDMLKEYEQVLYIPMSSGLSGTCMTAMSLAQEEEYEGKVFVVDNGKISVPLHRCLLDVMNLVETGLSAPEIKKILEDEREKMAIYIAVDTLEYLKKGGRITGAAAAIGTALNLKPILKIGTGKLDTFDKCRGMKKARKVMIEAMKKEVATTFKKEMEAGELYIMAATSSEEDVTSEWVKQIEEAFPGMEIMCDRLTCGITCHTGAGALAIACLKKTTA